MLCQHLDRRFNYCGTAIFNNLSLVKTGYRLLQQSYNEIISFVYINGLLMLSTDTTNFILIPQLWVRTVYNKVRVHKIEITLLIVHSYRRDCKL